MLSLGSNSHNFTPTRNKLMKFNSAVVYATDLSSDEGKTFEAFPKHIVKYDC